MNEIPLGPPPHKPWPWPGILAGLSLTVATISALFAGLAWHETGRQADVAARQLALASAPVLHLSCALRNPGDTTPQAGLIDAVTMAFPADAAQFTAVLGITGTERTWRNPFFPTTTPEITCELRNFGLSGVTNVSLHFQGDFFLRNTYGLGTPRVSAFVDTAPVSLAANGASAQTYIFEDNTCLSVIVKPPDTATATLPPNTSPQVVAVQINQIATDSGLWMKPNKIPKGYCTGI